MLMYYKHKCDTLDWNEKWSQVVCLSSGSNHSRNGIIILIRGNVCCRFIIWVVAWLSLAGSTYGSTRKTVLPATTSSIATTCGTVTIRSWFLVCHNWQQNVIFTFPTPIFGGQSYFDPSIKLNTCFEPFSMVFAFIQPDYHQLFVLF